MVCTDHGYLLGEHDCWAKNWMPLYEEVAHTPFFVWDPRCGKRGERRQALVQPAIDIPPTLLRFFGMEPTESMTGHDLADTVADDSPVRESAIFGYHGQWINVTDGRYVYMRAPESGNRPLSQFTLVFLIGGKRKFHLGHIDIPKWRQAVQKDRVQLQYLLDRAKATTPEHDGKLARLREEIFSKLDRPTTDRDGNPNRKMLIFTAFADTARYLHDHLTPALRERGAHVALVQGSEQNRSTLGPSNDYDDILTNFSPRSKNRAAQEDNLLENEQVDDLITKDLLFRNKQLKRMQSEILDLEDFEETISLADFSLDEFQIDLLQFLEAKREELEAAKPGLYAVVPPKPDIPASQPGVIFCLRHRVEQASLPATNRLQDSETARRINPLGRFYLVYVLDDGTVRITFTQPKQALNLFRDLAAGHPEAQQQLCDLFDQRTHDGADMGHYDGLIRKALESIAHTFSQRATASLFSQRATASLFSGRDGKLPGAAETPRELETEYELLTWLVILGNES